MFEDGLGNEYGFDSVPEQHIYLSAKKPEPSTWEIKEGIALVILGLFILISAIVFGYIRTKIASKEKTPTPRAGSLPGATAEQRVPMPQSQPQKKSKGGFFKKKSKSLDYRGAPQQTPQQAPLLPGPTGTPSYGPGASPPHFTPPQQQQPPQYNYQPRPGFQPPTTFNPSPPSPSTGPGPRPGLGPGPGGPLYTQPGPYQSPPQYQAPPQYKPPLQHYSN